jgi:HEAT repeat protein
MRRALRAALLLAGIVVVASLGLWVVKVVKIRIAVSRCRSDLSAVPGAIEHLGGRAGAPGKLDLYLDLPSFAAPHRLTAVNMLGSCGREAVPQLIARLEDGDESVRLRVVGILAELGDRRAVEPLLGALSDPSQALRRSVLQTLLSARYAKFTATPGPLVERLRDTGEASDLRAMAARVLGRQRSADAVPALRAVLEADDPALRAAAAGALERIEGK